MKKIRIKWEVIITIIISITGLYISYKANEMTKIQTQIARNSSLPNIQVDERQVIDTETGSVLEHIIEISNLEGKINNYSSRIVTFLCCEYIDESRNFYSVEIPIFSYYIIKYHSGQKEGILEEKITGQNWKKIEQLKSEIVEYVQIKEESLYVEVNSYLEITYVDLLGDKQSIYYSTDLFNTMLIENGREKFDKYDELLQCDLGINPNIKDSITVEELIDNIYKISELNYEENIEYASSLKRGKIEGMTEIFSAIIGAALAYLFATRQERKKDKKEEDHAASILYYDLKSIEEYLKEDEGTVNLRYSDEWQRMVAKCIFLNHKQVKCLYKIYDKTYNYNYFYNLMEQKKKKVIKEKVPCYNELRGIILGISADEYALEYEKTIDLLEKHVLHNEQ